MLDYFIYSILIGLIFRRFEIAAIPSHLSDVFNYDPLTYLIYAFSSVFIFILSHLLMKNVDSQVGKRIRERVLIMFNFFVLTWVFFVLNRNLEGIHGKSVEMTLDWFIIELIELGITLPLVIIAVIVFAIIIRFFTTSKKKRKGVPLRHVFAWLAVIVIMAESVVYTQFVGKDLKFGKADLPNIVLLSADTVRKDHLALYGYSRRTTLNLDRFFGEGLIFDRCIAAAPETGPNYASISTGTCPRTHGVFANGQKLDFAETKLHSLASRLKEIGYYTSSHLTAALPGTFTGLDYGLQDLYQHGVKVKSASGYSFLDLYNNCKNAFDTFLIDRRQGQERLNPETETAVRWLNHRPQEPFFTHLYWHWPHHPYGDRYIMSTSDFLAPVSNPEPTAGTSFAGAQSIKETRTKYDLDILFTDVQIGAVAYALERNGYLDNTIIVFTSDHGEELGQRLESGQPYFGHSKWLYETSTEVPLMIKLPGSKTEDGRRIIFPVSSIDIAPTLLELAGDVVPETMTGIPVVDHSGRIPVSLDTADRYVFSFNIEFDFAPLHEDLSAVFSTDWSFIIDHNTEPEELFNHRADPFSTFNLIDDEPETADSLRHILTSWMENNQYSPADIRTASPGKESLSPAALKNLKTLGYIK